MRRGANKMQYDETCLEYFLAHQEQLLPEPVACLLYTSDAADD